MIQWAKPSKAGMGNQDDNFVNFNNKKKYSRYLIAWPRESAAKFNNKNSIDYQRKVINESSFENLFDKSFNLTMSYRRDSDIQITPFGSKDLVLQQIYEKRKVMNELDDKYFMERILQDKKNCTEKAQDCLNTLWIVSNCNHTTESTNRFLFAQRLINSGLKVKGLGDCFNERVPGGNNKWNNLPEVKDLYKITSYKFYLAFENGKHCKDYISEKFWKNSLLNERVPIVSGPSKKDLLDVAPKHSFIHVEDFGNPNDPTDTSYDVKKLVNYINYLDHNDTAYMEYHQWRLEKPKKRAKPLYTNKKSNIWCTVCDDISRRIELNYPKRTVSSVAKWWYGTMDDEECFNGEFRGFLG